MIYAALPLAILAMLGFMFWATAFTMRRDRIATARPGRRRRSRTRR